jgi:hypothetical protein
MVGVDMNVARGLGIGPYVSFSTGAFVSASSATSIEGVSDSESADISDVAGHEWITLGLRGMFEVM